MSFDDYNYNFLNYMILIKEPDQNLGETKEKEISSRL